MIYVLMYNFTKINHFCQRYSQGLRLRQMDMMEDGIASSSRTLTKMASTLRKVLYQ